MAPTLPGSCVHFGGHGILMEQNLRIFIIADNRLLRGALARVFSKRSDLHLAGSTAFEPGRLAEMAESRPDVLLVDAVPAILEDFQFLHEVRERSRARVVLIGMDDDEEMFLRSVRAGVAGYLLKDASAMDVVAAVRAVVRDEAVCPPRLCRVLFRHVASRVPILPSARIRADFGLTRREQELIPLLADGMTNKEIALRMHLSEQTVKNHVHHMLRKVGVNDRLSVVELMRSQGLPL